MRKRLLPGVSGVPVLSSGFPMLSAIRSIVLRGSIASQALPRVHAKRGRRDCTAGGIGEPRQRRDDSVVSILVCRPEQVHDLAFDFESPAGVALDSKDVHIHEAANQRSYLTQRADPELLTQDRT